MFEFINRRQKNHLVLLPGWGFDWRIFRTLDLPYNYLYTRNEYLTDFQNGLKAALERNRIDMVSILGFSQGAFIASDFAGTNPAVVEEVILIGARKKYDKEILMNAKKLLTKNKKAYLYKFYRQCFSPQDGIPFQWFKRTLLKSYLSEMSLEQLIEGLDRLEQAEIQPRSLRGLRRVNIVHGRVDSIAPVSGALELAGSLPQSRLVIFEDAGHLPFLHKDFKKRLYEQ
jgi:pimeloyl-[acyl-carrier protein] methyl ester esterase